MYNSVGNLVWQADLDIYGKVRTLSKGNINDCPFRYQGQYHDTEVDLYYNRFRYYSPESGIYVSQDPIGLMSNSLSFYGYVNDVNMFIDPFGLSFTSIKAALNRAKDLAGIPRSQQFDRHGQKVVILQRKDQI